MARLGRVSVTCVHCLFGKQTEFGRFCSSPIHQIGSSAGYRACFVLIFPFVILHKSSSVFQTSWLELASLIVAAHTDVYTYCSLKDGLKECKRQMKQLISPIQTRLLWEGGAGRVVDVSWRSRRSKFKSAVESPFSSLADYHSSYSSAEVSGVTEIEGRADCAKMVIQPRFRSRDPPWPISLRMVHLKNK